MFAAIPYYGLGVYRLPVPGLGFEIPIDPWATLVAIGFVVGLEISRHRGMRLGMHPRDVVDAAVVIVASGFVFAHLVTVFAYHPERLVEEGIWSLLKFWDGFSSMGGFLGAVVGGLVFFRYVRKRPFWRYGDVIGYGFPFGWLLGRTGCAVVHDHIGRLTTSPLGVDFDRGLWSEGDPFSFADGVRFELGLMEAVYMLLVSALFLWLGRRDRVPGFFLGLFAVAYAPVRFGLDFLRNTDLEYADARYLGLTPGQYGSLALLALGIAVLATRDWRGFAPWPMDGSPNQGARSGSEE